MDKLVLISDKIIFAHGKVGPGYLVIDGPTIAEVGEGDVPSEYKDAELLDLGSWCVSPGFIDIHIHGAGGWNFASRGLKVHMLNGARYLASMGTTAFEPTCGTAPWEIITSVVGAARDAREVQQGEGLAGAEIIGLHMEGPFLNPEKPGAMNPGWMKKPNIPLMELLLAEGEGVITHITVAPEIEGALPFIAWLKSRGILAAGGHTNATAEQARLGVDAGIRLANHTYNAMRGLHHRDPGALGWYLTDDRVTCELISDAIHVDPVAMKLVIKSKGIDRVVTVSDATIAAGLPPGCYQSDGKIRNIDEQGRSTLDNGTISGSTMLSINGVKNYVEELGMGISSAVRLASLNPAKLVGLAHRKGSLEPGKDADIVVFDEGYEVKYSFVKGNQVMTPEINRLNLLNQDYKEMLVD